MSEAHREAEEVLPLKVFVKPDVHVLDVRGTETGPFPDPFEFPTILQAS